MQTSHILTIQYGECRAKGDPLEEVGKGSFNVSRAPAILLGGGGDFNVMLEMEPTKQPRGNPWSKAFWIFILEAEIYEMGSLNCGYTSRSTASSTSLS